MLRASQSEPTTTTIEALPGRKVLVRFDDHDGHRVLIDGPGFSAEMLHAELLILAGISQRHLAEVARVRLKDA